MIAVKGKEKKKEQEKIQKQQKSCGILVWYEELFLKKFFTSSKDESKFLVCMTISRIPIYSTAESEGDG